MMGMKMHYLSVILNNGEWVSRGGSDKDAE